MKKIFLITVILFQLTIVFGQSETLYSEQGVSLSYSATKYNTIELQNDIYDQYEVKVIFNNNSGRYIHQPRICRIGFSKDMEHPSSNSGFDFVQNGEAYGYVEYTDGTPLPESLDSPREDDKYGNVISRMIIAPNTSDECTKYVLVKSGAALEKPTFSVEFSNSYPVMVSGTNSLINTWVERQAKGISLNNVSSWPMVARNPFDGTNCGNARPIGNKGGEIKMKMKKLLAMDLINAIKNNSDNKIEIFKSYFIQEEYKFINENNCLNTVENVERKCLIFSNFSISFTNKGMCVISTGSSESLMNSIKSNLSSIDAFIIENQLYDNGIYTENWITFNQGELEYLND